LLERRPSLDVADLLAWHDQLPSLDRGTEAAEPRLVGTVLLLGSS
jgi:hypothetical protein